MSTMYILYIFFLKKNSFFPGFSVSCCVILRDYSVIFSEGLDFRDFT